MNLNENISNPIKRLEDWLQYNAQGNAVTNLPLDLLNRAKDWLSAYHQWDFLVKTQVLTPDAQRTCVLPTDVQTILEVYVDNNGDGKPDWWFYLNHPDVSKRYTFLDTYTSTLGHSFAITFPYNSVLLTVPVVKYSVLIPDYTGAVDGNGNYTEILAFPANLMLRCAQKIHCEEKGRSGDDIVAINKAFWEEMRIAEAMLQHQNQAMDITIKNAYGMPIKISGHSMDGRSRGQSYSPYVPSSWFHGY